MSRNRKHSQTSGETTEASRQNFEDPPNNQDQDIVQDQDSMQEQMQEQIQPENEINICEFYIVLQTWIKR